MRNVTYPPLEAVTRPALTTREAAYYLNRSETRLYHWAMNDDGPIRPFRVNGRLAWKTDDIRRVMRVMGDTPEGAK